MKGFIITGGLIAIMFAAIAVFTKTPPAQVRPQTALKQAEVPADPNSILISNYIFNPSPLKVNTGTKVTWTNRDIAKHNIVTDELSDPLIDGPLFGQGESYSYAFTKAGAYSYHCEPHPYMKAMIEVSD